MEILARAPGLPGKQRRPRLGFEVRVLSHPLIDVNCESGESFNLGIGGALKAQGTLCRVWGSIPRLSVSCVLVGG